MTFSVGSLVRARDREWVVLPGSTTEALLVRPLGGSEDEATGILPDIEPVAAARFAPPNPEDAGDFAASRLLRDALRLGFRGAAGPFRSFGHLACEPRPYQLVPLLMALRQDTVRLLIADDVGIGKTVEACLIARELLDRGEITSFCVLCPPHLAEQWQRELASKFNLRAELVLTSTAARLERGLAAGETIFDQHKITIISIDFIKSDGRRDDFIRRCPDLVIIDEAHACAFGDERRGGKHQRYQVVQRLAEKTDRHLILVTATPHSGDESAFRSLLTLLNPAFAHLPVDLSGEAAEPIRRQVALHLCQRRRADIRAYLDNTVFPDRQERDATYTLSPSYKDLFKQVLAYAREIVNLKDGGDCTKRVRWWSALALLRSLASSPAAAAATLRTRARRGQDDNVPEADRIGRQGVFDLTDDDEGDDAAPGADLSDSSSGSASPDKKRLLAMAESASRIAETGDSDSKLLGCVKLVQDLLKAGHRPIVFCRYIPTATYLAAQFRERLRGSVAVDAVTGTLSPNDREERVAALGAHAGQRVLVATDCLSEGINLQDHFDAVIHYDLAWNPTRHEQREGRVDRYGQANPQVRVVTYYGTDNQIDGLVLDILLKKHRTIRSSLGISVPVPANHQQVAEAIFEGLLLRGNPDAAQQTIFDELVAKPVVAEMDKAWESATEREKRSRTVFAQRAIHVDEVSRELAAVRDSLGDSADVRQFTLDALRLYGVRVDDQHDPIRIDLTGADAVLREAIGVFDTTAALAARFALPVADGVQYLTRTHPVVAGLASRIIDGALDPVAGRSPARRCGVIRTSAVSVRSTLLLLRGRYHLVTAQPGRAERTNLAEDCVVVGFQGAPAKAVWLDQSGIDALVAATTAGNLSHDIARDAIAAVVAALVPGSPLSQYLASAIQAHADTLLDAHKRVRSAALQSRTKMRVEPVLPPDVLGIFIYLPA